MDVGGKDPWTPGLRLLTVGEAEWCVAALTRRRRHGILFPFVEYNGRVTLLEQVTILIAYYVIICTASTHTKQLELTCQFPTLARSNHVCLLPSVKNRNMRVR